LELKMFDIGWSELVVIGVVALIAIGPKELPGALRTFGQWMGKVRRMAAEFQGQFQEAMREAEMADIKKQVDEMTTAAQDFTSYDPMTEVRKEINSLTGDPLGASTPPASADTPPTSPDTASTSSAAAASPEAAAPSTPAPVSSDFSVPQPSPSDPQSDLAVAAEAPQPKDKATPTPSSGSGG
jgi:sec-independent protein translocase protein TatB